MHETRHFSPCFFISRDQQIQQKIDFARDLNNNTNINKNSLITSTTPRYPRKLSLDSGISAFKARPRIASLGSSTASSFESCNSASSLFNRLDINEEKLAKTGNMFARREDWSIISKLPINKQNTIHIRLEDEGPYGNDETRCFVLSHFSSLGVRELSCIFCSCELIVYDRYVFFYSL